MSNTETHPSAPAAGVARRRRWSARLVAVVAVGAMTAGCASTARPASTPTTTAPTTPPTTTVPPTTTAPSTTTPSSSTTQPPASTTSFAVYFLRGNHLGVARRNVASTPAIGAAAVKALLAGPNSSEKTAGLSSAVPAGSALASLSISSGTATANFNSPYATPASPAAELQRVAAVVFTVTQFTAANRVAVQVDGVTPKRFASGAVDLTHPLGRSDVVGALPAILVESPAVGDALHGSLHLSGMANVFEAQFRVQLIDGAGHVLVDQPVHASAGTGTGGTFDTTFRFTATSTTMSTLRVYDVSMKDGSPMDEIDLHLPAGP